MYGQIVVRSSFQLKEPKGAVSQFYVVVFCPNVSCMQVTFQVLGTG